MKLIVGLGNPGDKYAKTRHNTGFRALDVLAKDSIWKESKKFRALIYPIDLFGEKVLLVKPLTFMNLSGQAVKRLLDFYKITPSDLLVIYDDIDLLAGHLRLRSEGSSGGHKGLSSIIQELGTEKVNRLKIGIAEKKAGKQDIPAEDFVLKKPTLSGEAKIKKSLALVPEIVRDWIS